MSATKWLAKQLAVWTRGQCEQALARCQAELAAERNPMVRSSLMQRVRMIGERLGQAERHRPGAG